MMNTRDKSLSISLTSLISKVTIYIGETKSRLTDTRETKHVESKKRGAG